MKLFKILLFATVFIFGGIFFESTGIIQSPAYFALYGFIAGIIAGKRN